MTDKIKYDKPLMKVVELQHKTMLLAGSNDGGGDLPPMGDPEDL